MKTFAIAVLTVMVSGQAWAECAGTMQFGCTSDDSRGVTATKEEMAVSVLCSQNRGETDEDKARIAQACADAKVALKKSQPSTSAPTLSDHNP